jgi:hypothetical protein
MAEAELCPQMHDELKILRNLYIGMSRELGWRSCMKTTMLIAVPG